MLLTVLMLSRLVFCEGIYTSEPSVKLLSVDFFAERFPAIASEFRVDLSGGEASVENNAQRPMFFSTGCSRGEEFP